MPIPIAVAVVLAAGKVAGTAMLKAKLLSALAPLKAYLVAQLGSSVASLSTGVITAAAAAAWWVKLNGGDEAEMEEAAARAGAGVTSREIAQWVSVHL